MEYSPISFHHDIAIIPILDIEHVLNEAESRVALGKSSHDLLT